MRVLEAAAQRAGQPARMGCAGPERQTGVRVIVQAMRVLLSDGSGLTARQAATQLAAAGHAVDVLSPDPWCLARFTRHVHHVRRVPPYGADPLRWLAAAVRVYQQAESDVLLPTQEQVAALSASAGQLRSAGVRTAVPSFTALAQVQDKISAFRTLVAVGLPQPPGAILATPAETSRWDRFPVYLKEPIGTATAGIHHVTRAGQLPVVIAKADEAGAFGDGGLLAQSPAAGPLVMVQVVADDGAIVACHASLRVREGARGGASHKLSMAVGAIGEHMRALCGYLGWRGALSADAILTDEGPLYIDINPRLVEPANAWRSGVDLISPLLGLACGRAAEPQPAGRAGIATHQLLLAVLGAAERTGRRRPVMTELAAALRHRGDYARSYEELAPVRGDPLAATPVTLAAAAIMVWPPAWQWFAASSVRNYALSPEGWRQLRAGAAGS